MMALMRNEVISAVDFVKKLLKAGNPSISVETLDKFGANLRDVMMSHYKTHWFPEAPFKGSGYRCVRLYHKVDPLIIKAGSASGLDADLLYTSLPKELTMWVDPGEVSYRIGENGSICVLYEFKPQKSKRSKKSCNKSHGMSFLEFQKLGQIATFVSS